MTELRLHRELYSGAQVDASVKVFEAYGKFELGEEPNYWVVKITGKSEARERQIKRELANFALGLTVKERKAS